jgi:hypothetical protein
MKMGLFPFRDKATDGPNGHEYGTQEQVDRTFQVFSEEVDWCFNGDGDPETNGCWSGEGNPGLPTTIVALITTYFGPPRPSKCINCLQMFVCMHVYVVYTTYTVLLFAVCIDRFNKKNKRGYPTA